MNYSLSFISAMVAAQFDNQLPGCPTENRVLILSPKEVNQTRGGLIIPEQVKEGVPRKGVIVKLGEITEEYRTYRDLVQMPVRNWNLKQTSLPQAYNNFWKRTL